MVPSLSEKMMALRVRVHSLAYTSDSLSYSRIASKPCDYEQ